MIFLMGRIILSFIFPLLDDNTSPMTAGVLYFFGACGEAPRPHYVGEGVAMLQPLFNSRDITAGLKVIVSHLLSWSFGLWARG